MSTLQERLQELRAEKPEISNADLARLAGVAAPSVTGWFKGSTKVLKWTSAQAVAQAYGVSDVWVATGEGEKRRGEGAAERYLLAQKVWRAGSKGGASLPEQLWTDQNRLMSAAPLEYAELATSDAKAFICETPDASMYPRFLPGEYVLVEPGADADIEDDVLVRLKDGQVLLRRLMSTRGGYRLGTYTSSDTMFYPQDAVSWVYYVAHAVPRRRVKTHA